MEAKEAPEKIYVHVRANKELGTTWHGVWIGVHDVEYTRTDSFIEKADKFISSFFHPDDTELKKSILNEFHKYMKGE